MNREHKFRAWDVENNEMIDGDSLAFEEYQPLAYLLQDSEYMKFMEYTGLKDCKEKDVYEGDIVEEHMFYVDENKNIVEKGKKVWEVVWKDFGWRVDDHNDNCNNVAIMDNADEYWSKHCTVIGNIYQNPELLKLKENKEDE